MDKKIKAYKALDNNMMLGAQYYKVGETSKGSKLHPYMSACTNPLDVLRYYSAAIVRFFEVECGGEISNAIARGDIGCTEMTCTNEISLRDLISAGVKTALILAKSALTATSGNWATATASDDWAGVAATSGSNSTAAASGHHSTAATSGGQSTAATSGNCAIAAALGACSTAATSGIRSTAATSGNCSTAATSGDQSTAAASGDWSIAAASGDRAAAKVTGKCSIAVANGCDCMASGSMGTYLVLAEYDRNYNLRWVKMRRVDGERIKADTPYTLKNGRFVEVRDVPTY